MTTILIIGLLGAVISAVTGTLWYAEKTPMGQWHMQYLGFDKLSEEEKSKLREEMKPKMAKVYGAQMLLSFLTSFFIGFVTKFTVQNGGPADAVFLYVPMIWACFTVPMIGQNILWGNCEGGLAWKKFFSDISYNLVTLLVISLVATMLV